MYIACCCQFFFLKDKQFSSCKLFVIDNHLPTICTFMRRKNHNNPVNKGKLLLFPIRETVPEMLQRVVLKQTDYDQPFEQRTKTYKPLLSFI